MAILTKEFASKVYDILIDEAHASIQMKDNFIYCLTDKKHECFEYRFMGNLLFGGKYWSDRNEVDYYSEDKSEDRDKIKIRINQRLKELKKLHSF